MLFDTHCHLNFKTFSKNIEQVIENALKSGVEAIVVPGTDLSSSKKAVEISKAYGHIFASVGIHPHHVFNKKEKELEEELEKIEKLLSEPKTVAVGEVGLDRYFYRKTKYQDYRIEEEFVNLQKKVFEKQIKLAVKHKKTLIIHSRLATEDTINQLKPWGNALSGRAVFHCAEPEPRLLDFAIKFKIAIGVDGDVCYDGTKQQFIKKVPLDHLVLETDSPFLSPDRIFPNQPANITKLNQTISDILKLPCEELAKTTSANAKNLFAIN